MESNAEFCHYHPGAPVFHEGMKFWSCCERKTSDFTSFLNQVGCEKADSHSWVHPDEATEKSKQTARYDYHQTPDKIYCNVYCKGIIPKNTKVVISSKRVDINVTILFIILFFIIFLGLLWQCRNRDVTARHRAVGEC